MPTKKYPKVDWKPLDKYSRKRMDKFEEIIQSYLEYERASKKWEPYQSYYKSDILAYNIAFLLLDI